jgi:phosphoribosylformylglycinamidine synthase
VLTASGAAAAAIIARAGGAGVPIRTLGSTGGDALTAKGERPILVAELLKSFEAWFPAFMGGGPA